MLISNISEKTELLQFDYCSGFFDLLLHLFGFFLCYAFFDGLGCAVNEFLSFFESEAGELLHELHHGELVGAAALKDHVEAGLLFGCGSATASGGACGHSYGSGCRCCFLVLRNAG